MKPFEKHAPKHSSKRREETLELKERKEGSIGIIGSDARRENLINIAAIVHL
jgi:hypothetical protein